MISIQETFLIRVLLPSPVGSKTIGRGYLTEWDVKRGHHLSKGKSEPASAAGARLGPMVLERH